MTFQEAAGLGREANPREMWLTHYSPSLMKPEEFLGEIREIFPRIKTARDGWSLELGFDEVVEEAQRNRKDNRMKRSSTDGDVYILAIESSCDETAAAVVKNGREVLSNIISSQIALHTLYGGVVPEIASRKHIEKINQVIEAALAEAKMTLGDMTAVAVTYGPGLVGALLVGVAEAKAIAYGAKKPLVGVHHIEGHVSANFIEHPDLEPPFVCLIVVRRAYPSGHRPGLWGI